MSTYSSYLAGCPPWLPRRSLPCWETRIYGVGTDESCCVRLVLWAADICSQVTGALLAQRYGGKIVLGSAGLAWSVLTCLTPLFLQVLDGGRNRCGCGSEHGQVRERLNRSSL